eukprot:scaffold87945_cov16-Tisochrysis_lutea.AAC.1
MSARIWHVKVVSLLPCFSAKSTCMVAKDSADVPSQLYPFIAVLNWRQQGQETMIILPFKEWN